MPPNLKTSISLIRHLSTRSILCKNHYDVLEITPKSTQADVKSAYYKLSMIYHPDRNENSTSAADKFRDITAAYEVLGNVKTRRMYDRGMSVAPPTNFDETIDKFHKSREVRSRPPAPHGRTTVYDFDEWSRAHYGATFARDLKNKASRRNWEVKKRAMVEDRKVERLFAVLGIVLIMGMVALGQKDYDAVGRGKE